MKDKIEQAAKEYAANILTTIDSEVELASKDFKQGAEWMQDQYKGLTPDIVQLMYNTLVVTIDMCTEQNDPDRKLWQSISYALSQANKELKP